LTPDQIRDRAKNLVDCYPNDIEKSIVEELVHFAEFMKTCDNCSPVIMLACIRKQNLQCVYPNVNVALRIYHCNFVTNCTGERSFLKLKHIKSELRTTMTQERLNALSLLSIESDLLNDLCFDEVLLEFSKAKVRKMPF